MSLARSLAALVPFLALGAPASQAQTLVKDFNTMPSTEVGSSSPSLLATLPNGELLITLFTPEYGTEPWLTDGTVAGTRLLADVQPGYQGSGPRQAAVLPNGTVVFSAITLDHGWELWTTDGTTAGTSLLADVYPGANGSVAIGLTTVGNEVLFLADDGVHGTEPWKTDGTPGGTTMIADLVPGLTGMSNGTAQLVRMGSSQVVFTARIGSIWELWVSDGTAAGTSSIAAFPNGFSFSGPTFLTTFGNQVLFSARVGSDDQRWITDGTPAGTFWLGAVGYGGFQVVGSRAYFRGYDPVARTEPWTTDGTVAGTMRIADLAPNVGIYQSSNPGFLGSIGNEVLFSAADDGLEYDLWKSDGTAAGTVKVSEASLVGSFTGSNYGSTVGSTFYFRGNDGVSDGLWRTDGTTAGTVFVHPDVFTPVTPVGGTLFAAGADAAHGYEPWTTDGTTAGTQLLVDLAPSPVSDHGYPEILGTFRDRAVVFVDDGVIGRELWLSDGTPAGTQPLIDLEPGPDGIHTSGIASTESYFLFHAAAGFLSEEPWVSDGTAAGTQQLQLSASFPGFRAYGPTIAFGDEVVFLATTDALGAEPWITDGTTAGTHVIADLAPGSGADSNPNDLHTWNGRVFFLATTPGVGYEPWVTDGTAAGTTLLADTAPGTGGISNPGWHGFGDHLYFRPRAFGVPQELWRTDGTPGGTAPFVDLNGAEDSAPADLLTVGDRLLFTALVGTQRQLHASDGTAAGTVALTSVAGDLFGPLRVSDDLCALFVTAGGPGQTTYTTWWTSDGTQAGTQFQGPLEVSAPYLVDPRNPTDDQLVFTGDDPATGTELWTTDGTVAGTRLLVDLSPANASPRYATQVGDRLLFVGDDGLHGTELFSVPITDVGDEVVRTYGFGVPGTNGVPTIDVEGEADASGVVPFEIVVEDALASTGVILAWSRDLAALPFAGVTLWTGGNLQFVVGGSDATGRATFPFLPNPTLVGQRFVAQGFALDPAGAAFGVASATAGLELVVGP